MMLKHRRKVESDGPHFREEIDILFWVVGGTRHFGESPKRRLIGAVCMSIRLSDTDSLITLLHGVDLPT